MTTVHAFPNDWTVSRVLYTGAAIIAGGAMIAGSIAFLADGAKNTAPAHNPAPEAVVTTTDAPSPTHLAPRCFETSVNGAQDCAWVPVAPCESDEDGDDAVPDGYDGCYWDAPNRGNHVGSSYVYWRLNRD